MVLSPTTSRSGPPLDVFFCLSGGKGDGSRLKKPVEIVEHFLLVGWLGARASRYEPRCAWEPLRAGGWAWPDEGEGVAEEDVTPRDMARVWKKTIRYAQA